MPALTRQSLSAGHAQVIIILLSLARLFAEYLLRTNLATPSHLGSLTDQVLLCVFLSLLILVPNRKLIWGLFSLAAILDLLVFMTTPLARAITLFYAVKNLNVTAEWILNLWIEFPWQAYVPHFLTACIYWIIVFATLVYFRDRIVPPMSAKAETEPIS
jgi:hypothetical protein